MHMTFDIYIPIQKYDFGQNFIEMQYSVFGMHVETKCMYSSANGDINPRQRHF